MTPEGVVQASGGATLYVTSLVEGATVVVTADNALYDTESGLAELDGNVRLALDEFGLGVEADYLLYDPLMERLELRGVRVEIPVGVLFDGGLTRVRPRAELPGHVYVGVLDAVCFASGDAFLDLDPRHPALVLRDVRLTHSTAPNPDLYASFSELRLVEGNRLAARDIGVVMSGWKLFTWPSASKRFPPEPGWFSFRPPRVSVERDRGVAWQQPVNFDFNLVKANTLLDYSTGGGLLVHGFIFLEPFEGAKAGVEYGRRRVVDVRQVDSEQRTRYNYVYRQHIGGPDWLRGVDAGLEYGRMQLRPERANENDPPAPVVEDTRFKAGIDAEFTPVPLGGNWYVAAGGSYKYVDYRDAEQDYRVLGGRVGLIWQRSSFNHFVLYRFNDASGEPVFSTDREREQALDFATSLRLHPSWRQVVQGVYDIGEGEFAQMQVGLLKRQRSYEIGLYYDFVRESTGLEFGLLFN